jgi:predicted ester cyclase
MASIEDNKALVRLMFERIVNQGELDLADQVFAPDFRWPQFSLTGPDGVRSWVRSLRIAFPDVHDTVEEQVAEGDTVITRVTLRGTQDGPWGALPPSGRRAEFPAIGIDRFARGLVVERFALFDMADAMRQLGHSTILGLPTATGRHPL